MTRSVYLCRADHEVCLDKVAAAAQRALGRHGAVQRFEPIVVQPDSGWFGTTTQEFSENPDQALATIIERYVAEQTGGAPNIVVGSDMPMLGALELPWNTRIAANLGVPVVLVLSSSRESELRQRALLAIREAESNHASVVGIIIQCKDSRPSTTLIEALAGIQIPVTIATIGDGPVIVTADGDLGSLLDQLDAKSILLLDSSDAESLLGVAMAASSGEAPAPGAVVLAGEAAVDERLQAFWTDKIPDLELQRVPRPRHEVREALEQQVSATLDLERILAAADNAGPGAMTPLRFQQNLLRRAREADRHIVLPEGDDDRILEAADRLLAEGVCRLTILGDPADMCARAEALGVDISDAQLVDPSASASLEKYAARYAELRAKKGVTIEQARERMLDVSYFGTMMVFENDADGMVSGASHTTAHTIRPSFETIKTKPGVSVVSSVFLMCLADRVLVFGDCAVNPNPTPEQIAEIAISSAQTAQQFGVDPRIAMLSYSTGASGAGPDVDATVEATELVRQKAPHLIVDGPLQYDAAVVESVGKKKMPGSSVAGRATVMVFPDLKSGNIAYKAVQRSADALALGPILQGLNKPINDLSRGALVSDIINTVAITAIQGGDGG